MEVLFREYHPEDLEALYRLDLECFDPAFRFSRKAMRGFAEAEQAVTVVAECSGELVGFAIAEVADGAAYIATVDVGRRWRRQGLGRRLMEKIEVKTRAEGACSLILHVFTANHGAVQMYSALGYRRLGLAQGFYGRNLDAWVFEKQLHPPEQAPDNRHS